MFRYVFKSIKNRKSIFIFMTLGFFTILSVLPIILSSINTTRAMVTNGITKYARGQFDILVRNENSISELERKLNLVEENYLVSTKGGITLKQYEEIKEIEGIDAAAPVSTLGYFTSHKNAINVSYPNTKGYHMRADIYTSDGVRDYLIKSENFYQFPYKPVNKGNLEDAPFLFIPPSVWGTSSARGMTDYAILLPDVWDMLVAIDPIEEEKLTEMSKSIVSGKYFKSEKINIVNKPGGSWKAREIPIIINESARIPLRVDLYYDNLNINALESEEIIKRILNNGMESNTRNICLEEEGDSINGRIPIYKIDEAIKKYKDKASTKNSIDLTSFLKPFTNSNLVLIGEGEDILPKDKGDFFNVDQGSMYYESLPIEYDGEMNNLKAIPKDVMNGVPIFRPLKRIGNNIDNVKKDEIAIEFKDIGHVKFQEKDKEKLNGSPLGIYGDSYVSLVEDENGKKVENQEVISTINPGSFVPAAPHGYTTLEAAEIFKGEKPIDAIRIRVKGITKYDESARIKIERVAKEINKATGLHTDIVAGSSSRDIIVSIPGIRDVSGLGKVAERWTTLGTAIEIIKTWDLMGVILLILYLVGGCIFIINRVSCSILSRKKELGILKVLGWNDTKISHLICIENVIASIIATIISSIVSVIVFRIYELEEVKLILFVSMIMGNMLTIFISYYFSRYELKKSDFIDIQSGDIRRKKSRGVNSLWRVILINIFSYGKRSKLLILQIGLTGGLALFTFLLVLATKKYIGYTSLGAHINIVTEDIMKLLVAGASILVVFTEFDRFSTMVLERKNEIKVLKTLGWTNKTIIKMICGEALLLSVIGGILAMIVSLSGFRILYRELPTNLTNIFIIFITIILIAFGTCIYPLLKGIILNAKGSSKTFEM